MKQDNAKIWLLIDSSLKKLKRGRHWTTSADSWKNNMDEAIKQLEKALEKIEET